MIVPTKIFECLLWQPYFIINETKELCKPKVNCLSAAGGIGFHVNADNTEDPSFNQRGDIFTLKCGLLKLMDKFIYVWSRVSFTENDINKRREKE